MKFETPYSRAWKAFIKTKEYETLLALSSDTDEDEKYAANRLRTAFDAGWNAKTSSILEAINAMSDKGKTK